MSFCEDCPFRSRWVGTRGPADAEIAIVGEAPGPTEVRKKTPFIGESGDLLAETLKQVGIDEASVFVTNAISCLPPRSGKKDQVLNKAIRACHGRLHGELSAYPRKLIIAVGNGACRSLTGEYGFAITKRRGQVIDSDYAEHGILPTFHPAHVLRNEGLWPQFISDFERAAAIMNEQTPPEVDDSYETVDWALARAAGKILGEDVACDIETTGLDPFDDEFLCLGASDGKRTLIAPSKRLASAMLGSLVQHKRRLIWHNGKFDQKFLHAKGWPIKHVPVNEDTMLLSYTLDENTGRHSLEQCVIDHLGMPAYKDMVEEYVGTGKNRKSYADIPKPVLYRYLARDLISTKGVFDVLRPRVRENPSLEKQYRKLLIPASKTLVRIERNGLPVSQEKVAKAETELGERADTLLTKLRDLADDPAFNPNSAQQVLPVLQARGLKVRATNKDVLKDHSDDEFVAAQLEYRRVGKLLSTYVMPFKAAHAGSLVRSDGRVYTTFHLHKTVTGRLSSSPNFQNIPQEKAIRDIVTAMKDRVLLSLDYSQAELRSLAVLSGDPDLLGIFKRGDDLHGSVATKMFGPNFTKAQRTAAKRVNFGIVYGITNVGLAAQLGCDRREAQDYLDFWLGSFPVAHDFIERSRRRGKIVTVYGRHRRLHVRTRQNKHRLENQAGNFEHQSMCSDLTLESAIRINEGISRYRGRPLQINIVHDDNLFEIDDDEGAVRRFARDAKRIMEKVPREKGIDEIPFEVDPDVGKSWGSLVSIDEYYEQGDDVTSDQPAALQIA